MRALSFTYADPLHEGRTADTAGGSDTFTGAYAVEFVRQKHMGLWDIRKAVEYGCKASARTIESIGAQESIPWEDEVSREPVVDAAPEVIHE